VQQRLQELREAAGGSDNLLPAIRQALKDRCSIGEVCGAMQDVFGKYAPTF
jgi:methylmalonyl-CoA mutase N-terminal domain/subunit